MKLAFSGPRPLGLSPLSRRAQSRLVLGAFFAFLVFIGVENQLQMPHEIEAFRNDAYALRLHDQIRREFLAWQAGRSGALDVRAGSLQTRLGEIADRLDLPLPERLVLKDGPAGEGRLSGRGHPYLGGKPEKTVWRLIPGRPGGSLELDARPEGEETLPFEGDEEE